ncbi:unnamed protein product [Vicia faba]|uniref:Retrovirus-related Pol polyprotein from transposon TNT 1-94-like beta-barrel domain-containing protein n=1 Tax=Vicia faba TaxID=3906 RepID=A0AAV0YIT3_VICFA|nr:unnamed protein product [Vicia faba]
MWRTPVLKTLALEEPIQVVVVAEIGLIEDMNEVRGNMLNRGYGHGRGRSTSGNRPTCKLCGKYGHFVPTCWNRFDENFMLHESTNSQSNTGDNFNQKQESTSDSAKSSQAMVMMTTTQEHSLPSELESQFWFADSCASHHLTPYAHLLHTKLSYVEPNKVCVRNGQNLTIQSIRSIHFYPRANPNYKLILTNVLHVPSITKNILSVSKFSSDNNVMFEFFSNKCCIISQASKKVIVEEVLDKYGL